VCKVIFIGIPSEDDILDAAMKTTTMEDTSILSLIRTWFYLYRHAFTCQTRGHGILVLKEE
jgi:hypothetical protein